MASTPKAKKSARKKTATKRATKSVTKRVAKTTASATRAKSRAKGGAFVPEDEGPSEPGTQSLVIVESPAKAKTISKYLGRGYRVRATIGHVRDLPEKRIGIDIEHGFTPEYVTIPGKEKTLTELKNAAKDAREIFLATDPDREGEAIAWHVASQIQRKGGAPIRRVLFHEITKDAVREAIDRAGVINEHLVEAQQARRVLDRLVGYKASPVLWKTVKKGISAGRVQTVALRLLVEREREIRAFTPVEYWTIEALLEKAEQQFTAKLHHVDGKRPEITNEAQATQIITDLRDRKFFPVTEIKRRERRKNPSGPFTTSTLQQEAAKKLGFGSKRTMRLAQDLYEGIELGPEGAVGLITYMRTDSTRIAESAASAAQSYLKTLFGDAFLAKGIQLYGDGKSKNTQDAHEAIRPTDPIRRPDTVKRYLSPDQFKLYELIWKRFMASQMAPAVFDTTTVDFNLGKYLFRSTGSVIKFQGFLVLYKETREEGDSRALEDEQALPAAGERRGRPGQEDRAVPALHRAATALLGSESRERAGTARHWAAIHVRVYHLDPCGSSLRGAAATTLSPNIARRASRAQLMVKSLPDVFNVQFTSNMEADLDKVEEGTTDWRIMLGAFYGPFSDRVKNADLEGLISVAHDIKQFEGQLCPDCGGKLVPRGGFFGPFMACENHPKTCKFTRPLRGDRKPARVTDEICHECGELMVVRTGRSGEFLGCSKFPKCRGTRSMPTGVKCPKDGGDIAVRRSKKRGKSFYGCTNYPACDFVLWDKPVPEVCPECGYEGAESKFTKTRGDYRKCLKCQNEWDVVAEAPEAAEPAEAVVA